MSFPEPADRRSVLYLQREPSGTAADSPKWSSELEIETATRRDIRVRLQIDDKDYEIQRVEQTSTWVPTRSLELVEASNIKVFVKTGHRVAGLPIRKLEASVEFGIQEAMEAFWNSQGSISQRTTFDERPITVTLKLRPSSTGEATRAAVQELQEEMKTYRVLMKDSTEHTVDMIFKNGAVLAEMNPIVKVAFSVAKGAFEVLKEQKKRDEAVSELADGVGRILPFAELVIEDIICEETELLERVVGNLCALMNDTASFVCEYAKQSLTRRLVKSNTSADASSKIKALQSDLAKLEKDFDRAVDVTALKMAKKNDDFRLLDRLKPTGTAGYQESRGCMAGTRTAVLDHLVDWASKPESQIKTSSDSNVARMYWLYGSPGLGKTSIANSLCNRLHDSKNLGEIFFCRRDDPILREPKRVLPTLISKLAGMWGPYRKLVAQALQDDPQLDPESRRGEVLFSLLEKVQKCPSRMLVLVIDALDECGDYVTRNQLLTCLLEACSRVSWIKVIITSRPENDIKTFFEKNHISSRDLAEDDQAHDDIQLFTRRRMASIASRRYLSSDWPGEGRIKQITDQSGGLFIFTETLCRFVDGHNANALLAKVLDGGLGDANARLHQLYSTAILSSIGQSTEEFHSLAQAFVFVAAYRPLPDQTLASLMGLEHGIVRSLVDGLSSILYRDESSNGGIRVRHLSVIDFLTGPTCPKEFRVVREEANRKLGVRCLTTMMKELKFNICNLETSCRSNAEIPDLKYRVQLRMSDALQYSCMYWASHLCSDSRPASKSPSEFLGMLLTGAPLLYWLEALSLMGQVPVAISALRLMKISFKKLEDQDQRYVEGALRFVLAFFTPISTSAPHIYISGLAFMPVECDLWKCASLSFPELMDVCKGRMKSWPAPLSVWQGHTGPVYSIAYSPDGLNVVSSSGDKTIRIWDAQTGVVVGESLKGHTGSVWSVAYSPDGRNIVSGSDEKTIRIWDAQTGAAVGKPLTGHTDSVWSVAYSPDGRNIVSGSFDYTIQIWDVQAGVAVGEPLKGHAGWIRSVAYSPDGLNIVSGSGDGIIRIWDVETVGAVGEPLKVYAGELWCVAYSPDGRNIVSGTSNGTIRIRDVKTGEVVGGPLKGHTQLPHSVAYSTDGQKIVSGSSDGTIRIWDVQTGAAVRGPLRGHIGQIHCVAYSPDGRHVISGADDRTIRIWDVETGAAAGEPLNEHSEGILSVAYSPDGRNIVSGSRDNTIRIWDARTGAAVGESLKGHTGHIHSVTYSPDGLNIASGSADGTIQIWDVRTGAVVRESLRGHTGSVRAVAYSPDGRNIVSGSSDDTIRIWDAETGAAVRDPMMGHSLLVWSVAYSPDGRNIVFGSEDNTIRIWDAQTGAVVGESLKGHSGLILSLAYSLDGRNIVSGSIDQTVRISDVQTGAAVGGALEGHTQHIGCVAYSPNGRNVVSGSADDTIRIWDVQTGAPVGDPLKGHTRQVYSVAYSPDGRNIISGAGDKTIRVWEAHTNLEKDDRRALPQSSKSSDDDLPLRVFSGLPIPTKMLDSNGWVRGKEGLLFWVPEDCRDGLTCSAIMTIPTSGQHRPVRIDFTRFQYGTSWTNIRGNNVGGDYSGSN